MAADSPLSPGSQILHYRVTEKLGAGGMGEVWKAQDSTLGRDIALKALPPAFAADPERLGRFEREAKLLAGLNHPNIATVYSVHEVQGTRYLAMEYVPGEDLSKRVARGAVPVREALEIARQVALALEAAHEQGVVHRDLKPANIVVTPDDRVKVLDFGLAKALEGGAASGAMSQSPTYAGTLAASGVILGTAGYMSPEQARGKPVDRRADIWAFGVVLHELLTGARAFDGETISDTLAASLRAEPDHSALPELSPAVRAMLMRCLEKDPRRRLRDIGEALLVIEDALAGRTPTAPAPSAVAAPAAAARANPVVWVAALAAVAVLAAFGGALLRPRAPEEPVRRLSLRLDEGPDPITSLVLSPDGRRIAFVRGRELWVRDMDQMASRRLAGDLNTNLRPAWSPGSDRIAYAAANRLFSCEVSSGAATGLCASGDLSGGAGATWLGDSVIVYARGQDHLYRVAATGGTTGVWLARVDTLETDLHHPYALPGGRGVLFVRHLLTSGPQVLCVRAGDGRIKELLRLTDGLLWEPVYDPRGWIVFARAGDAAGVWAVPFSLDRLEVTGEQRLIVAEATSASVAAGGLLLCRPGASVFHSGLAVITRAGVIVDTLIAPIAGMASLDLSPDGRHVAIESRLGGDADCLLFDLERHSTTRFASGPGRQTVPAWSVDGASVIYRSDPDGGRIVIRPADGSQRGTPLVFGANPRPTPEGRHVLYHAGTPPDIWQASLDGRDSLLLIGTPATEVNPWPHPSAGYLLYQSDEGGTRNVYLAEYPGGKARWQVSTREGELPFWSPRGDRAYYYEGDLLYEVAVALSPTVRLGEPKLLFDLQKQGLQNWGRMTVLPTTDPDRFLALFRERDRVTGLADAVQIENWSAELGSSAAKRK